jgi:hypothetical protein
MAGDIPCPWPYRDRWSLHEWPLFNLQPFKNYKHSHEEFRIIRTNNGYIISWDNLATDHIDTVQLVYNTLEEVLTKLKELLE